MRFHPIRKSALIGATFSCLVLGGCDRQAQDPTRQATLDALGRSLEWMAAHRPDPARAPLGEIGMDTWSWNLFSRLHPDPAIQSRAAREARSRLQALEPVVEPTLTSLSWWATLIRNLDSQGFDVGPYLEAVSETDVEAVVREGNPTTGLWISELLRYSGFPIESSVSGTFIAENAAAEEAFKPTVRGAVALYHEIAPVTDLGRKPLRGFSRAQIAFAARILPALLQVSRGQQDIDAFAEALIASALLGERGQPYYREGIEWLLSQQRPDGTYPLSPARVAGRGPEHFRHAILVVSWALLESLR